ncbi:MAG: exo-alpha-sialidase, partial [Spirochaetales bacterium]|nr:exo-alpha-sialidase [Spirochaetales bacterium]
LTVMTTGEGREGATGQYIATQRSTDLGRTWTDRTRLEAAGGPEASWGVLLKAPGGRVFCFYIHNSDNIRAVRADPDAPLSVSGMQDGYNKRVDSLGYYVFRYSDDNGVVWSDTRYTIPVRAFEIDENNTHRGEIRFFWNVGRPFVHEGTAFVPLHKVGGFGAGFFTSSEGALVSSSNLIEVDDPDDAEWETLPDGKVGIRPPESGGPIAEEHSFAVLSDGSFFTVYRTVSGYSARAYSRDKGRTWSDPEFMTFADGRRIKNPRAANFVWRCSNGKYLYWFHNHGGSAVLDGHMKDGGYPYNHRNPVWLAAGTEIETPQGRGIEWCEPEILLYEDDPMIRMSYPDMIEENSTYYFTETQKDTARIHQVDSRIIDGLFGQFDIPSAPDVRPVISVQKAAGLRKPVPAIDLPAFTTRDAARLDFGGRDEREGLTIDIEFALDSLEPGQILLDSISSYGKGIQLRTVTEGLEFYMTDGQHRAAAPISADLVTARKLARLTFLIDGGPKVISTVCNGRFDDGGEMRQFGWTRFSPTFL